MSMALWRFDYWKRLNSHTKEVALRPVSFVLLRNYKKDRRILKFMRIVGGYGWKETCMMRDFPISECRRLRMSCISLLYFFAIYREFNLISLIVCTTTNGDVFNVQHPQFFSRKWKLK